MSSQPSQTRIVNRALTLIGTSKRVLAADDNGPEARTMLALFDDARDAVLTDHPWHFAVQRAVIAADTDPPKWGYANAFPLPADCLRWLPAPRAALDPYPVELEGTRLVTDLPAPLSIRYIARVVDVALWSQGFVNALAYRLAAEAAEPLTADKGIGDRLMQRYGDALSRAKRQDGQSSGETRGGEDAAQSTWLAARVVTSGWGGRGWRD